MKFVFLIPLFPLLGFMFNFLVGVRALRRAQHEGRGHGDHEHGVHVPPPTFIGYVAAGAVLASFVVALVAVIAAHGAPEHTLVETLWAWLPGGAAQTVHGPVPFHVDWAYQVDPLSSVMLLVVTFVGFFIHVYSIG